MHVVKLGGSLVESGRLGAILDIVALATQRVVIVPGGGPFADAVRDLQPRLRLADPLCHRLALLAMHQMGLVMAAKNARLKPCQTLDAMADAHQAGAIPVWLPITLQYTDDTLPADWTVTSDALAARLAERLGHGASVALVKSCAVTQPTTLDRLSTQGITDRVFATVVRRANLRWHVFGLGDEAALAVYLGPTANRAGA